MISAHCRKTSSLTREDRVKPIPIFSTIFFQPGDPYGIDSPDSEPPSIFLNASPILRASLTVGEEVHRGDESPAGYSSARCSPTELASASPAERHPGGEEGN